MSESESSSEELSFCFDLLFLFSFIASSSIAFNSFSISTNELSLTLGRAAFPFNPFFSLTVQKHDREQNKFDYPT